jgi:hypothetical protein
MVLRGRWQGKERERTIVVITVVYPNVSQVRKAVLVTPLPMNTSGLFATSENMTKSETAWQVRKEGRT